MSYNYRCNQRDCRQRTALAHPMEWYIKERKCPACKRLTLRHDPWVRQQAITRTCNCGYVAFPHRRGTMSRDWGICEHVPYNIANDFMENDK